MLAVIVGLALMGLGLWGVSRWFSDFVHVFRGLAPVCLFVAGLIALVAGLSTLGKASREKNKK